MAAEGDPTVVVRARGAGAWTLRARDPMLGGNVPLRAAQACSPFLAGNALGLVLAPPAPLRVARSWRGLRCAPPAASARVVARDLVELVFDTGLALSAPAGTALVLERAHNRGDRRVDVAPDRVTADGVTPVAVALRVRWPRGARELTLEGELASIAAWPADPGPSLRVCDLLEAPDVLASHLRFFDAAYFAAKREAPTRKYRSEQRRARGGDVTASAPGDVVRVVPIGGAALARRELAGRACLEVYLEARAELGYHGQRVEVRMDPRALARRGAAIVADLARARPELGAESGAVRYFTTYATAHAPGDPHMFFKPAVLLATPPGTCAVLDGPQGATYAALRGVTESSWFHALPAVLELQGPRAVLPAGTLLTRVRWIPEALLRLRAVPG